MRLGRSLVARVALFTALSVVVASATVALVSQLIAGRLTRAREDTALSDAAETVALELRRPGADPVWIANDEARELIHAGIRITIFQGTERVEGDPALHPLPANSCRDQGSLRVCARAGGRWLGVVARDQTTLRAQQNQLVYASVLAVLLTSLLGALGARALAGVATAPLVRLRRAVESVPEADPSAVKLGPPVGLTEVDALRDSLHAAFERLGGAMLQSRRFASDAAHELRTPLATLTGELELAAEVLSPADAESLGRARHVATRMAILLDRLLVLARLDALQDLERVELRELVDESIDTLTPAQRARVVIESDAQRDLLAVTGDRALLISSLTNGLENALKFSSGEVTVTLAPRGDEAVVSIVDMGPGIALQESELVFAPFYRTATSRAARVPGHGIGLSLIAHVMALHHGSARFVPNTRGAHLELVWPRADELEPQPAI